MEESRKNEITIDQDGIIHVAIYGYLVKDEIIRMREELLALRSQINGKRLRIFADITKFNGISFDARIEGVSSVKVFEEIAQVAVVGTSFLQTILSVIIVAVFGLGHKLRVFKTKEEAIAWLKEEQYKDIHFIK